MAPIAKSLNVELRPIEVSGKGYADALSAAGSIEGLMIVDAGQFQGDADIIAAAAIERRSPTAASPLSARAGALIGYGISFQEFSAAPRSSSTRSSRGRSPATFRSSGDEVYTIVNLKTARRSASRFRRACSPQPMR